MDRGRSRTLHGAERARDIERATPPRVDINQQRQSRDLGNAANVDQNVFHAADTEIGHAQRVRRHAPSGNVKRAKPRRLRHARRVGIDGANHL